MDQAAARDYILNHALDVTDDQFEQLCKIVIERAEKTRELQLTPFRQDGGIDVHAVVDRDLFFARLGVQAKQNGETNNVSSPEMQEFKGALSDNEYRIGTFITTSDFTGPAVESAEKDRIRTINGTRLAEIMTASELGVVQADDGFEADPEFWEIFDLADEGDLLASEEIPQADRVEILDIALRGIREGYDVKPTITEYLETKTGEEWDPRQADYYTTAAWPLGFVHKDTETECDGREMRQWGLTRIGEEYVEYLTDGRSEEAEQLLFRRIEATEITRRVLDELREKDSLVRSELYDVVARETYAEGHPKGLSRITSDRRASTVGNWLAKLPYVHKRSVGGGEIRYEYNGAQITDR